MKQGYWKAIASTVNMEDCDIVVNLVHGVYKDRLKNFKDTVCLLLSFQTLLTNQVYPNQITNCELVLKNVREEQQVAQLEQQAAEVEVVELVRECNRFVNPCEQRP